MIKQLAGLILAFLPAFSHSSSSFGADYVTEYIAGRMVNLETTSLSEWRFLASRCTVMGRTMAFLGLGAP
jgi:hypothetical protein